MKKSKAYHLDIRANRKNAYGIEFAHFNIQHNLSENQKQNILLTCCSASNYTCVVVAFCVRLLNGIRCLFCYRLTAQTTRSAAFKHLSVSIW